MNMRKALIYARSIRNEAKRNYAYNCISWAEEGGFGNMPECPDGLSYMAAQAVRNRILEYCSEKTRN